MIEKKTKLRGKVKKKRDETVSRGCFSSKNDKREQERHHGEKMKGKVFIR